VGVHRGISYVYTYCMASKKIKMKNAYIPSTIDDLYSLIEELAENRELISIRGAGTSPYPIYGKRRNMVILSRLEDFDISSNYVILSCGSKLSTIKKFLSQRGLFFPMLSTHFDGETIGGALSERRMIIGYGPIGINHFIDSIEVTLYGERSVLHGRDINKFIGSLGRYGVLVRCKVRCIDNDIIRSIVLEVDNYNDIINMAKKIYAFGASPLFMLCIGYVDRNFLYITYIESSSRVRKRFNSLLNKFEGMFNTNIYEDEFVREAQSHVENFYVNTLSDDGIIRHCEIDLKPPYIFHNDPPKIADQFIIDFMSNRIYMSLKKNINLKKVYKQLRSMNTSTRLLRLNIDGKILVEGEMLNSISYYKKTYDTHLLYP